MSMPFLIETLKKAHEGRIETKAFRTSIVVILYSEMSD